jgi:hypothetical protein
MEENIKIALLGANKMGKIGIKGLVFLGTICLFPDSYKDYTRKCI